MANVASAGLGQALSLGTQDSSKVLSAGPQNWVADLNALNQSGVDGRATFSLNGDELTVRVNATGLEANQLHPMHIHGASPSGVAQQSLVPTIAQDTNHDGAISLSESQASAGPPILDLGGASGQLAGAGHLQFTQTFDLNESGVISGGASPTTLFPLGMRTIELHGGINPATNTWDPTLPVAAAQIEPASAAAASTAQANLPPTVLVTGGGNDVLMGGRSDDVLQGGSGNDVLAGNAGDNVLTGGSGGDRFLVTTGHTVITDFSSGQGDRLVLNVGDNAQRFLASAEDSTQGVTLTTPEGGQVVLAGVHTIGTEADWIA